MLLLWRNHWQAGMLLLPGQVVMPLATVWPARLPPSTYSLRPRQVLQLRRLLQLTRLQQMCPQPAPLSK
jgi:hypothetical protein